MTERQIEDWLRAWGESKPLTARLTIRRTILVVPEWAADILAPTYHRWPGEPVNDNKSHIEGVT